MLKLDSGEDGNCYCLDPRHRGPHPERKARRKQLKREALQQIKRSAAEPHEHEFLRIFISMPGDLEYRIARRNGPWIINRYRRNPDGSIRELSVPSASELFQVISECFTHAKVKK